MDKKLNEVTKVTDMAYVPVIMSDGSIGQIAKADLVSVVAGVIGSYNYKGFYDSNLDNLKVQGFYNLTENVTNVPSEYSGYKNASFVLVFMYSDTQGQQTFLGRQGSVFHRTLYNGNWSAWSRIDNFGYNTLADLATALKPLLELS